MANIFKLANNYVELNPPMVQLHSTDMGGFFYINTPLNAGDFSDGFVKYTIDIPIDGIYKVVALTSSKDTIANSFYVSWDYGFKIIFDFVPSTVFKWNNVSSRGTGVYLDPEVPLYIENLIAGPHSLIIYSRETESKLKEICVTNDLDYLVPKPTTTSSPTPGNSYTNWLNNKGGKPGLKNNLPDLLEIVDGYLGFKNLGFTVSLGNVLQTMDGYLGF